MIHFLFIILNLHILIGGELGNQLSKAFVENNSKALSQHFSDQVELTLITVEDTYSKNQAEILVKDFFTKNPVQSFNISHTSSPKNGTYFMVGNLLSEKGKFKVYILLKQSLEKTSIQQLRIEPEK